DGARLRPHRQRSARRLPRHDEPARRCVRQRLRGCRHLHVRRGSSHRGTRPPCLPVRDPFQRTAHRPEHPQTRHGPPLAPDGRSRGSAGRDRPAHRLGHRCPAPPAIPGLRRWGGRRRRTRSLGRAAARRRRLEVNVPTDLGLVSSIGICTGAAALIAAVTWRFKQPLFIAYLATGGIIGPIGLKFVTDQGSISTVAETGLILLLFVIGLEIDIRKMASGGAAVLLTGALQVPICIALGLAFFWVLGVRNAPGNSALLYL